MSLRVLITNNTLAGRAGTELYVRDVAIALLRRGLKPIAYSTVLGDVADELRGATVPVIDRLDALAAPPDLIHGHHHLETMTAVLRFPGIPAIYFCHGWLPWEETPLKFPRIRRYIAVDETCRDRLLDEHAIPREKVRLLLNFVDLKRFKPRGPLPGKPARALIFGNSAREDTNLPALREACARAKITLDAIGSGVGNATRQPEHVLPNYDLVFAKGRAALEALSVGAAVVLLDAAGVGPMVTTANMENLRSLNFGIRTLQHPIDADVIGRRISRYNAADAMQVSAWIRKTAAMDGAVDHLIALYNEVLDEHRQDPGNDTAAEFQAASNYLRQWVPKIDGLRAEHQALRTEHEALRIKHEALRTEHETLRIEHEALRIEHEALRTEHQALRIKHDTLRRKRDTLRTERDHLQTVLATVYDSPSLRLRNHLIAIPLFGPPLRSFARFIARSLR
jgi:FtsZ-binding cell division protein ZapB